MPIVVIAARIIPAPLIRVFYLRACRTSVPHRQAKHFLPYLDIYFTMILDSTTVPYRFSAAIPAVAIR